MNIKPVEQYLVLKAVEVPSDGLAPPVKDDWLFEVKQSYDKQFPLGSKVIVKELTVKTDNYVITHIDNVVGVVE